MIETCDIRRRGFLFGAAATLVVAAPKKFFIMSPPKLIVAAAINPRELILDLPAQQMFDLMKKLQDQAIEVSALPRWIVVNPEVYDKLVGEEGAHARTS